jgi:hypothetical protein
MVRSTWMKFYFCYNLACLFLRFSLQMHLTCIPFVPFALCRTLQNFACLIEYITYSHVKYIYYKIYELGAKTPFSEPNICPKCKQETLYRVWCMCWQSFVISFIWNIQVHLNSYIFLISWFNWIMKLFFYLINILYLAYTFDVRRRISLKTGYKIIFTF